MKDSVLQQNAVWCSKVASAGGGITFFLPALSEIHKKRVGRWAVKVASGHVGMLPKTVIRVYPPAC